MEPRLPQDLVQGSGLRAVHRRLVDDGHGPQTVELGQRQEEQEEQPVDSEQDERVQTDVGIPRA